MPLQDFLTALSKNRHARTLVLKQHLQPEIFQGVKPLKVSARSRCLVQVVRRVPLLAHYALYPFAIFLASLRINSLATSLGFAPLSSSFILALCSARN